MKPSLNQFRPDYAVPPGRVLEERLEVYGISHAELAQRCGCSPEHIGGILAGEVSIGPEIADHFEREMGLAAGIWLGIEKEYRSRQGR